MKDYLNAEVKHREPFRPYGVSILEEEAAQYFHIGVPSPFMLLVAQARADKKRLIPSGLHVDGSSRLQTVNREDNGLYYDVIRAFRDLTGVPMVINTSFNDDGQPIVCTPEDAYECFTNTKIDALVMGNLVAETGCSSGSRTTAP